MLRFLYTSADNGLRYWKLTRPFLTGYAEKVGAELIVLPKTTRANRTWCLFDAMQDSMQREGEFVWIDSDIVIRKNAPDIFSLADRLFVCAPDPPNRVHRKWLRAHVTQKVPNCRPYPVTAVVKWSHRHAEPLLGWLGTRPLWHRWGDQEVLALASYELELPFFFMPQHWHAMSAHIGSHTSFYHAAGGSKIRKLVKIIRDLRSKNLV
jgi:hypothetical protein